MKRWHLILTDRSGKTKKVPADPANLERQIRDYRAKGYDAYAVDDDDAIKYGQLQKRLVEAHKKGWL